LDCSPPKSFIGRTADYTFSHTCQAGTIVVSLCFLLYYSTGCFLDLDFYSLLLCSFCLIRLYINNRARCRPFGQLNNRWYYYSTYSYPLFTVWRGEFTAESSPRNRVLLGPTAYCERSMIHGPRSSEAHSIRHNRHSVL